MAKFSEAEIKKRFPQVAFLMNVPEIRRLLKKAFDAQEKGTFNANEFKAEIQATKYFRSTSDSQRAYAAMASTNPAELKAKLRGRRAEITNTMRSLGMSGIKGLDGWKIAKLAESNNWNDAQLNDYLLGLVKYKSSDYAGGINKRIGTLGTLMTQIKQQNSEYFLKIGNKDAFNWAKKIASGELAPEDFKVHLQNQAIGKMPHLQQWFEKGITGKQLFEQHFQEAANLLEINAEQIDPVNDARFAPILGKKDDKGNIAPMTISETGQYIRGLDEWKKTRNGQESAASAAQGILEKFGAVK